MKPRARTCRQPFGLRCPRCHGHFHARPSRSKGLVFGSRKAPKPCCHKAALAFDAAFGAPVLFGPRRSGFAAITESYLNTIPTLARILVQKSPTLVRALRKRRVSLYLAFAPAGGAHGWASAGGTVFLAASDDSAETAAVLVHEICHVVRPGGHHARWRRLLVTCAGEIAGRPVANHRRPTLVRALRRWIERERQEAA